MVAFFAQTLRSHVGVDEAHLFPAVVAHLPGAADLVGDLLDEHEAMRTRSRDLDRDPTTDRDVRLPALGRLLETHVRREERVLFETMQREMAPADLETLDTRRGRRAPEDASVVLRLLQHLGLPTQIPEPSPARPPPLALDGLAARGAHADIVFDSRS